LLPLSCVERLEELELLPALDEDKLLPLLSPFRTVDGVAGGSFDLAGDAVRSTS
jgi:hypothetical protein